MAKYACIGIVLVLLGWSYGEAGDTSSAVPADAITWKKTVIDRKFRSEGIAVADVNRDGKNDLLIGDAWYEAPSWKMHAIRKIGDYGDGLRSYSNCMACWADDLNHDGWPDQIVIGFPGKEAFWYENPRGGSGHWKEHTIWHSACNETPQYVDLFGTGRRVLVMGWQPKGQQRQGQMAWFEPGDDPTQLWKMHPISRPSSPGREIPGTFRFSHGLGIGDVNADGRLDVICTGGWWEQPPRVSDKPWPFHRANLGPACADMFTCDVDGDRVPDVISTSAHKFGIWWYQQRAGNGSDPAFVQNTFFKDLVSETHAAHFVDINGDGVKDLVTGKRWWSHGRREPGADMPPILYWFEARRGADGLLRLIPHEIDRSSGVGTQFTVTDYNGDGLLDIAVANKRGVFLIEQVRNP